MGTDNKHPTTILLADDDTDDAFLFRHALKEVCTETRLIIATDGQELMEMLSTYTAPYPDAIFLDLNMPRKNGLECLEEIKSIENLKHIPIIIFSTTAQERSVYATYQRGAHFYIQKPNSFQELKNLIKKAININWHEETSQPALENYILQSYTA